MQLQYPLLFPLGEDGFHTKIKLVKHNKQTQRPDTENSREFGDIEGGKKQRDHVSMMEYYSYKLMIRPSEGIYSHVFSSMLLLCLNL